MEDKAPTVLLCGSSTPLWRFPSVRTASTTKRPGLDPELLAWLRPQKRQRKHVPRPPPAPPTPPAPRPKYNLAVRSGRPHDPSCPACRGRHRRHTCSDAPPYIEERSTPQTQLAEDASCDEQPACPPARKPRYSQQLQSDRRMALQLQREEEQAAIAEGASIRAARRASRSGLSSSASRSSRRHEAARGGAGGPSAVPYALSSPYSSSCTTSARYHLADDLDEVAGRDTCTVCYGSMELLLCRGHREASESSGRATEGHIVCASCVTRWHLSKNELLAQNGLLQRSRRECPVCKCELRCSSMRDGGGLHHFNGLEKLLETWEAAEGEEGKEEEGGSIVPSDDDEDDEEPIVLEAAEAS